jgi:hypothetical protein
MRRSAVPVFLAALLSLAAAPAADTAREPCAHRNPLRSVWFGDLHVHTAFSQDAATGGTRATPRDAYRFAKGEPLGAPPWRGDQPLRRFQLDRPLDFAAVTDHAELLGEVHICRTPGLPGHDSWVCRISRNWPRLAFFVMNARHSLGERKRFGLCGEDGAGCLEAARTPWREIRDAAEAAYDRTAACTFTSFVGYEWTASENTRNLHRNVIFRNERVPELPTSVYEAPRVEGLWRALRRECLDRGDGCDALVIPHNSNLSDGLMFEPSDSEGRPLTAESAAERARSELLVEVMQHKGDSECTPEDSADELCAFEKLSIANFMQNYLPGFWARPPPPRSYVRRALKDGLLLEERLGVNPFRLGMIASTDTHLGTPGLVREDAHPGHGGAGTPPSAVPDGLPDNVEYGPGGLAAIWAEENSRDSLFDALQRREVYGTSGPRLRVRFFGGWRYAEDLCDSDTLVERGYAHGVPMGGQLPPPPAAGAAPRFAVHALRDPGTAERPGTPLQRIQIVKGWVEGGETREAVYDVAGRSDDAAGVDLATCTPYGPGADALCSVWRDPDFDPGQRAFYYVRVLENPVCRWSQYVCNAHGVDCARDVGLLPPSLAPCCAPSHRPVIQERAWTSPIWYSPESGS